jgi:riboflavin synthase
VFTGLVRERGRLIADPRASVRGGVLLEIAHSAGLGARLGVGASLAVAGVCLTLIESDAERSVVELSPETLARTRFGRMRAGSEVNLEPALLAGEPLGGHWVQGHVDGVVELAARRDHSDHSRFTFTFPPAFDPWIVEKGSVAIDGVSLTVASRADASFDVALIPHTLDVTTLGAARPGARHHFEADILAKYVERALGGRRFAGEAR